jgi:hypothetical protein
MIYDRNRFFDFIDFAAKRMGMPREDYIATYLSAGVFENESLSEKKSSKLNYLWLSFNERGGRLYSATFKYDNKDEIRLSYGDEKEIEERIKDAYGLDVEVYDIQDIEKSEDKLYKLSKKLKIDFTIYEHDLS